MNGPFQGPRFGHVAVAVRDLDASEGLYTEHLGLAAAERVCIPSEGVMAAFIAVGTAQIELIEPLGPGGTLANFLAKRGEGIHHLALVVPNLEAAIARARAAGLRMIGDSPKTGAGGTTVAFFHASSAHGVLIELIEMGLEK
jgi:methylmalonyl-CoA epimerase